jgi:ACS family glucarate transporter-like MFS transporter
VNLNLRRYTVVALAVAVNLVSYLDRVSISVAAPALRSEFGFTPLQMGQVFSAFSLSYAIFQAPWGAAADRFGARAIVTLGILGWSLFTGLTAAAWNLISLLTIRFTFGAIEACLSPAVSSAFGRWIPVSQRSTAFGIFLGGGRLGGAIGPAIAALLVLRYGWRSSFVAFAGLGVVAGAAWWHYYRDSSDIPRTDKPRGPTKVSAPLVFLLLAAFSYTLMWQFYITWFPTYLVEKRGFGLVDAGKFAGLPFLFGLAATWMGGFASDGLARRFGLRVGRAGFAFVALMVSALLLYTGVSAGDRTTAAILMALAAGVGDLMLGAAWATAVDIGGKDAGAVSGLMNSSSNFGGFVSPIAFGWVLQTWKDWNAVLFVAAFANVLAACFWLGVRVPEPPD